MSTVPRRAGARQRRFSKREYYQMGELGFFQGQRVELIKGRLMVQSPQGPGHSTSVDRVARILENYFGEGHWVRRQYPLDLGQASEPEPDVSVVIGSLEQYTTAHPTTALLIVEVSDTSLAYDRGRKGSFYALAGITDYWIVNLVDGQLETYRDPTLDPNELYGHRYASRSDLAAGATVTPLALPLAVIPVASLLP